MKVESPRRRMYRRELAEYGKHHGRVPTWLYGMRRLLIALFILTPILWLFAMSTIVVFTAWVVVILGNVAIDQWRVVPRMPR